MIDGLLNIFIFYDISHFCLRLVLNFFFAQLKLSTVNFELEIIVFVILKLIQIQLST